MKKFAHRFFKPAARAKMYLVNFIDNLTINGLSGSIFINVRKNQFQAVI
jgi:hypothetical protein